jgi:hypothetical protein
MMRYFAIRLKIYQKLQISFHLRYITREGAGTWSMAVKMHRIYTFTHRKTKSLLPETEKTKEERTANKALDLEILKMQMAMVPIPEYYRGSSKTGDEEASKSIRGDIGSHSYTGTTST